MDKNYKGILILCGLLLFVTAASAWSVDNCPGGKWVPISSSCEYSWCMTKQYSCPTLYASIAECQLNNFVCAATSGNTKTEYWSTSATFYWCNGPQCPKAPCSNNSDAYYNGTITYEWRCPAPPPSPCISADCGKQCGPDMGSSASIVSGNLFHDQTLFQIPNTKPAVDFTIAYNSLDTYAGSLGKGWTHSFNINITQSGSSLTLMKQDGKRVNFTSGSSGAYYSDAKSGEHSTITKNSDSTYTQTTKEGIIYSFNASGKLTRIKDRNNNTTALSYTGDNLASITDSSGRAIQLTYDVNRRIIQLRTPSSQLITFSYAGDSLASVTDPQGNAWQYTYGANGKMLSKTDPQAYATRYTYDTNGRITQSQDPEGKIKAISYQPSANSATVTEKDGSVWRYKYDSSLNVPLEVTDPLGGVTRYSYDSNKNLIKKTEPDGTATTYGYDSSGNMTSQTDALGQTTAYTYNGYGQVTGVKDPLGYTTGYEYDNSGNLIKTTDPQGASTQYQYDSKGNITRLTNANGQTTTLAYDSYNNLTSIIDPSGASASFAYDTNGNMTSQTDASGATTYFQYNSLNQLIKITDSLGNITQYGYDRDGNKTSQTDANGNTTRYEYNYKGKLTRVTDALGNVTIYAYGGSGCSSCGGGGDNLTSITDARGNKTSYQYDTLGRLIKETDPLGNSISYTYDSKGNLTSKKDANGNTIAYTYDQLNRLIKKSYPDSAFESFTYDAKGNIITASNQNIAYVLAYDANSRMTSIKDSNNRTLNYRYDGAGRKTNLIMPDGKAIEYKYDPSSRLIQIKAPSPLASTSSPLHQGEGKGEGGVGGEGLFAFAYDKSGRRTKLTLPNSATANYSYDTSGRLTGLAHKTSSGEIIASYAYTMDKTGNRLTKTEALTFPSSSPININTKKPLPEQASQRAKEIQEMKNRSPITRGSETQETTHAYGYDRIYRLTEAQSSNPGWSPGKDRGKGKNIGIIHAAEQQKELYAYDPTGNRLTGPKASQTYTYNQANQLLYNGGAYTYDKNGNLIKKTERNDDGSTTTWNYTYDFENRLIKAIEQKDNEITKTVSFKYDPFGRRIEKKVEGVEDKEEGKEGENEDGDEDEKGIKPQGQKPTPKSLALAAQDKGKDNKGNKGNERGNAGGNDKGKPTPPRGKALGKGKQPPSPLAGEGKGEGTITRYFYDNEDILFEYDERGNIGNSYIHGPGIDEPLALTNSMGTYYYHADGLGSIVALTDSNGKTQQTYEYDSFGNLKDQKNKIKQPYTYTGREWDKETGLYYYRARYYDPKTGRFISFDPILHPGNGVPARSCSQSAIYPSLDSLKEKPQKLNPFVYVQNNPIRYIDPLGLFNVPDPQAIWQYLKCMANCIPVTIPQSPYPDPNPLTNPGSFGNALGWAIGKCHDQCRPKNFCTNIDIKWQLLPQQQQQTASVILTIGTITVIILLSPVGL